MDERNELKGALWLKESEKAGKYMGGNVQIDGKEYFINVFKNRHKEKETHPDYNVLLKPKDGQSAPAAQVQEVFKDDVPF